MEVDVRGLSQQVLLPSATHGQIWKVSFFERTRGPPGRAGEDGEGVLSTEEKVEEWRSQREERGGAKFDRRQEG